MIVGLKSLAELQVASKVISWQKQKKFAKSKINFLNDFAMGSSPVAIN